MPFNAANRARLEQTIRRAMETFRSIRAMSDTPSRVSPSATAAKPKHLHECISPHIDDCFDRGHCKCECGETWPIVRQGSSPVQHTPPRSPSSPVPSSETDLEKMLIEHERLCMEDLRAAFVAEDASRSVESVTTRILNSRWRIESYVSRLRDERDRLRNDLRCKGLTFEQKFTLGRLAYELMGGEDGAPIQWDKLRPALASLKERQLTRYEAETVLMSLERKPFKGPEFDDRCDAGDRASAKLRLLSTSDSEQK